MKLSADFFKGFGTSLLINFVVLLAIYLLFEKVGSFTFFLESAWDLKTLVGYLSIASFVNGVLFYFMVQRPKTDFAQGTLAQIIVVLAFTALLKFFL